MRCFVTVTKHDIEWLINTLEAYTDILSADLVREARELIQASHYRKSVCVIHPVDEAAYALVRTRLERALDTQ